MLPRRDRPDFLDVDLAGDHVVPEADHDLGEQLEPVALLVRDQDPQLLGARHAAKIERLPQFAVVSATGSAPARSEG